MSRLTKEAKWKSIGFGTIETITIIIIAPLQSVRRLDKVKNSY